MPKINIRKEISQCLKALIKKNEKSLKDIEKTLSYEVDLMENEEYFYIYRWILSLKAKLSVYESSRYLTKVRQPVLRRSGKFLEDVLNMDEGRFVQHARMSRSAFFILIDTIKDLPGYNPLNKRRPQEDIRVQILCVLIRLGNHGNASSIGQIAYKCEVSEGSVSKFTERFFEAILSIQSEYIKRPSGEREQTIMEETYKTAEFENCVGFVDGTPCVLEYRPIEREDEFFTRKGNYAIQTIAVCDHERRITYIETGFYGRRHDANIFRRSLMGKNSSDYFKDKEYILGDSAYLLEQYLVTPFRQNSTGLSKRHKVFNFHHSRVRVAIENCFGIMKIRFQSLRGMPNQLKEQSMIINPSAWIVACAVLHNMLLGENDSIVEEAEEQVRRDLSTS